MPAGKRRWEGVRRGCKDDSPRRRFREGDSKRTGRNRKRRGSVAVTSNIHPSGFDTIMPKALAIPTVDRLLHHAHVIITEGESQRLVQAMTGKGVVPLS